MNFTHTKNVDANTWLMGFTLLCLCSNDTFSWNVFPIFSDKHLLTFQVTWASSRLWNLFWYGQPLPTNGNDNYLLFAPQAMTSGMPLNFVTFACLWVSLPSLHPLHLPPEQTQYHMPLPATSVYLEHGRYLRCHVEQINDILHTSLCLYGETKHSKWFVT